MWLWTTGVPAYSARNSNRCCNVSAAPPASTSVRCTGMSADTRTGPIYSGPIGAVLSPLLGGYDEYKELPYASSLCAACTEACPVKIPLHELLLKHRQNIVEKEGKAPISEKLAMKAFGLGSSSPSLYKMGSKWAPAAMTPFTEDDKISKGPGR